MRKIREPISSKLNMVDMTIEQLKREGKENTWTSFDFWKRFIIIRDYIKKSGHKKLQKVLNN